MSLSILIIISLVGCGTIMGKRVTVEKGEISELPKFSKFRLTVDRKSNTQYLDASIDNLMQKKGLKKIYTQGELNKLKENYLSVELYIKKGFCLPPIWGHLDLIFFMPKTAIITLSDGLSKKELLKVEYNRGFFATNAGPYECKDMIISELKKAFAESKLPITQPELGH